MHELLAVHPQPDVLLVVYTSNNVEVVPLDNCEGSLA